MTRMKLLALWFVCTLAMPFLSIAMLVQALAGSEKRAKSMAVAQDECGNALFGGPPQQTISARTGDGLIYGSRWAKIAAPFIDFFFGAGHCLANVDLPANALTKAQQLAVDAACVQRGYPPTYFVDSSAK